MLAQKLSFLCVVITSVGILVTPADGGGPDPILSFQFTDMDGDFVAGLPGAGTFTSNDQPATAGDVTRLTPIVTTADYNQGFPNLIADVNITMALTLIDNDSAIGNGAFFIIDADGDSLTGSITGEWTALDGAAAFLGNLFNVFVNDNSAVDATFDGPSGGSFSTAFDDPQPFPGALVQLTLPDHWFGNGSFDDANTSANAQIVPDPAGLVLCLAGAASLVIRRGRGRGPC